MTSARSVCMSVSRAFGAGLCGVGSITLNGGKGRTRETKYQESGSKFIKLWKEQIAIYLLFPVIWLL